MENLVLDERINRYFKTDPDKVLAEIKGDSYRKYREDWNSITPDNTVQCEAPLQINVEVSNYCNLKCKMCALADNKVINPQNISMDLIDNIVVQAKDLNVKSIFLGSGSECLLHPNIIPIINKFSEINPLDFWLLTNGTMLTEDVARAIIDSGVTRVCVSLDAASPKLYKNIRGADLQKITNNILNLLELREKANSRLPLVRVSFVDMKENHHEKQQFLNQWIDVIDWVDFQKFIDNRKFKDDSVKINDFFCAYPYKLVLIHHDGEIWPCCNMMYNPTEKIYIQDCTIAEYWNSKKYKLFLQSLRDKKYMDCCKRCRDK